MSLILLLASAIPGGGSTRSLQTACLADPVVTSNSDSGAGSLRDAIATACDGGIITFSTTVATPITLASELSIEHSLTIQGPGAGFLTISGNHMVRVFSIGRLTGGLDVTLSGLTIADGQQAPPSQEGEGGGIYFGSGTLTIANSMLSGNSVTGGIEGLGGGIFHAGDTLNVTNSWLVGNSASSSSIGIPGGGSDGGAIFNAGNGTVNVTNSTISGNFVDGVGGFGLGGGIYNNNMGKVNVANSTLSGNTATGSVAFGGGIHSGAGTVTITDSTLSGNTADAEAAGTFAFGGGIFSTSPVLLKNSIVAGNTVRGGTLTRGADVYNCCGTHGIVSQGYNLIGKGDPTVDLADGVNHDLVGSVAAPLNPLLDPAGLQDNGGPTPTIALLAGSPAIDQGSAATDPATLRPIVTDQRGFTRPIDDSHTPNATGGDGSDIGAFEFLASRCTTIVTNNNDSGAGSLREAIAASCVGGTITFAPTVASPITLTTSQLSIEKSLTIQGPGAGALTISGNHAFRVFEIGSLGPIIVTLSGLTIANGSVTSDFGEGGGIFLGSGTLTIVNSTLSGNSVSSVTECFGGGIFNESATLNLLNSLLSDNSASSRSGGGGGSDGGGIFNFEGMVNITNSTISGNSVNGGIGVGFGFGGGIDNDTTGTVNVTNSTLTGNTATGIRAEGGGIINGLGRVTITNSTLSGNIANTISGGLASGGGISNGGGTVVVKNTIVAGNTVTGDTLRQGPDLSNGIVSQGYNLIGVGDLGMGFVDGVNHDHVGSMGTPLDPKLDPNGLQDNGGPTPTIALLPGSPAIDQGSAANDPATLLPITTDQRGFPRPVNDPSTPDPPYGNLSDIGAFEFLSGTQPTISAVNIELQQGSLSANLQIGTVSDLGQSASTLRVTAAPASGSGVTLSNITINASGQVFADAVASCAATNSSFTLTVAASSALSASAALAVTVSADIPPMLGNYPAIVGPINPGTTAIVQPSAAPSDIGAFNVSGSAPGFGGALSVDAKTGVATVGDAGPPGVYAVTVKATDSCGLVSTRGFTLAVNHPPTISGQNVLLQEGTLINPPVRIATVSDIEDSKSALLVRVNLGSSATVNGVTLSQISVGPLGVVRAHAVAACGASTANFTLTVTDSGGLSANVPLLIAVSKNTPPTLGQYSTASVRAGASTTIFPSAPPADNGVITGLTAASNGAFSGGLGMDPLNGAVNVTNAGPLGVFLVTVTARDNCRATSLRRLFLRVRPF